MGSYLTVKVTNGGTGPTVAATINILIAHTTGSTPAAASAGTDWKTINSILTTTANNAIHEIGMEIPPGVLHLEVEITGNTGQTVTVEAFASTAASIA